ncbi:MAG: putative metalloprotease CJM1_0395 family protein [Campylobacterota bacterium]|nr:putative metalloprotease CJM1_0395 family protein [Campylobacterota bacterium]
MDIITENYENISVTQLYAKLSAKTAQLNKLEQVQKLEEVKSKDYVELSTQGKNLDEKDFARVLDKFKQKDSEVRSHEQVHASIGATTTPISYNYQKGPDGKMYAVGGSVRMETSIPTDPKEASFKLDKIADAATGSAEVSGADTTIAMQSNLNKVLLQLKGDEDASK